MEIAGGERRRFRPPRRGQVLVGAGRLAGRAMRPPPAPTRGSCAHAASSARSASSRLRAASRSAARSAHRACFCSTASRRRRPASRRLVEGSALRGVVGCPLPGGLGALRQALRVVLLARRVVRGGAQVGGRFLAGRARSPRLPSVVRAAATSSRVGPSSAGCRASSSSRPACRSRGPLPRRRSVVRPRRWAPARRPPLDVEGVQPFGDPGRRLPRRLRREHRVMGGGRGSSSSSEAAAAARLAVSPAACNPERCAAGSSGWAEAACASRSRSFSASWRAARASSPAASSSSVRQTWRRIRPRSVGLSSTRSRAKRPCGRTTVRRKASLSSPSRALMRSLTGLTCSTCSAAGAVCAPRRRSCALAGPTLPWPSRRSVRATSHVSPETWNRSTTRRCSRGVVHQLLVALGGEGRLSVEGVGDRLQDGGLAGPGVADDGHVVAAGEVDGDGRPERPQPFDGEVHGAHVSSGPRSPSRRGCRASPARAGRAASGRSRPAAPARRCPGPARRARRPLRGAP